VSVTRPLQARASIGVAMLRTPLANLRAMVEGVEAGIVDDPPVRLPEPTRR
jgi:hypothetical protein